MKDIIEDIQSQIALLKVHIHELQSENKRLKKKLKEVRNDLESFFKKKD